MRKRREVPPINEREGLTIDEAAELLNIGYVTAYKAVKSGEIPSIRIGKKRIIVSKNALLKMFENKEV